MATELKINTTPQYQNHGKKWVPEDDEKLAAYLANGSLEGASAEFGRSPDAVWLRLLHIVSQREMPELMKKHNIDSETISQYKIDLEERRKRQKEMASIRNAERQAAKAAKKAEREAAKAAEQAAREAERAANRQQRRRQPVKINKDEYIEKKITEARGLLLNVNSAIARIEDIFSEISIARAEKQ